MLNNSLMSIVKGIIVENTYEMYENNEEMCQKSLEWTELEFQNMTESDCLDKYRHIVDEHCQMCDNCGEWFAIDDEDSHISTGTQELCMNCYEDFYYVCAGCGDVCHIDDMTECYHNHEEFDTYVCDYCQNYSSDVEYCQYHERYEYDNRNSFYEVAEYGFICQDAFENGEFAICDDCCNTFCVDDVHFDDCGVYCDECWENNGYGVISGYHTSDFEFMTVDDIDFQEEIGLGFELELEFDRSARLMEYATELNDEISGIHLEDDCSLRNGFEVITNPMTIEYFEQQFTTEIDRIVDICASEYNYDHNSAGFHVHVTKEDSEQTYKLALLVEYFKEELTKLSKRDERQLDRWASFYTQGLEKAEFDNNVYETLRKEIYLGHNRYHALNTTNYHTNEFRIFKGSLDAQEIKARVEICHNFNQYAKYNDINLDNMPSFIEVATFDKNEYVTDYMYKEFGTLAI